MTNYEKYKDEILKAIFVGKSSCQFTTELRTSGKPNCMLDCCTCAKANREWLDKEYQEPSAIQIKKDTPVDTLILVSDDGKTWKPRYFAGFDYDAVMVWANGTTSMTANRCTISFSYAKPYVK